jgi:cyclophilin family peptidyl-prolyl cis-trans isomerase
VIEFLVHFSFLFRAVLAFGGRCTPSSRRVFHITVFGKVSSGLDVIDKIEAVGSQSGRTAAPVVIKDCGEL